MQRPSSFITEQDSPDLHVSTFHRKRLPTRTTVHVLVSGSNSSVWTPYANMPDVSVTHAGPSCLISFVTHNYRHTTHMQLILQRSIRKYRSFSCATLLQTQLLFDIWGALTKEWQSEEKTCGRSLWWEIESEITLASPPPATETIVWVTMRCVGLFVFLNSRQFRTLWIGRDQPRLEESMHGLRGTERECGRWRSSRAGPGHRRPKRPPRAPSPEGGAKSQCLHILFIFVLFWCTTQVI